MPESLTYTKLENQLVRITYNQVYPFDMPTEVSQLAEWSGGAQNGSLAYNLSGDIDELVFYKNYIAQSFRISASSSNVRIIRSVGWYGRKTGSPPGNLIAQIREGEFRQNVIVNTRVSFTNTNATGVYRLYGGIQYYSQSFNSGSSGWILGYITLRMLRIGTPPTGNMKVELWNDAKSTKIADSTSVSTSVLTPSYQDVTFIFPTKPSLSANTNYRFRLRFETCPVGGDDNNCVRILFGRGSGNAAEISTNCGSSWSTLQESGTNVGFYFLAGETVDDYFPTSKILASTSWTPSEIGTTNAWYEKTLDRPIAVNSNTGFVLVFLQDAYLGNSSNCYIFQRSPSNYYSDGFLYISNDAGTTWTISNISSGIYSTHDLLFRIIGDVPIKIYEGTVNLAEVGQKMPAAGRLNITVRARATSGTIRLFGVAGSACGEASTTSISLTDLTVLSKDINIPEQTNNLKWEVWASGTGLADRYTIQRYSYFNKKDITPKDLNAAELYLAGYTLPANSAFMLNDEAGNIYSNEGTSEVSKILPDAFNVYVKKLSFIRGTPTVELLKVI
ncbi:MAG: hypothetical protein RMJ14_01775 [Nitrososphaerota archaeon]|nr:hypothetical protein [Nitrososphaerota archaeon]